MSLSHLDIAFINAAKEGNLAELERLYELGPVLNPNDIGVHEKSALDESIIKDHQDCFNFLINLPGINVNNMNSGGCTAIHHAGCFNREYYIDALWLHGANLEHVGNGRNAFGWAKYGGNSNIIAYLQGRSTNPDPVNNNPKASQIITLQRSLKDLKVDEVYDFERLERTVIFRNYQSNPISAQSQPFDSLTLEADRASLREAFTKYAQKGGLKTESEIPGLSAAITKLQRRNQP